ncbi:MAG: energy transducer TonB [Chlorobiaceae bacterium]|nr:energy transducer TonB [Chlorobiaceae bacterium]
MVDDNTEQLPIHNFMTPIMNKLSMVPNLSSARLLSCRILGALRVAIVFVVWMSVAIAHAEAETSDVQSEMGDIGYRWCEVPPAIVSVPEPVYPKLALLAEIQGRVYVHVLVDEQGVPVKAEIVKRVPQQCTVFDKAALESAMSSSFVPGQQNGEKVKAWITIPFRFALQQPYHVMPGQR